MDVSWYEGLEKFFNFLSGVGEKAEQVVPVEAATEIDEIFILHGGLLVGIGALSFYFHKTNEDEGG